MEDVFIFVVLCSLLQIPLLLTMSEQSMIASDSAHLNEIKNKEPRSHVQRLEIQFCCRTSLLQIISQIQRVILRLADLSREMGAGLWPV